MYYILLYTMHSMLYARRSNDARGGFIGGRASGKKKPLEFEAFQTYRPRLKIYLFEL